MESDISTANRHDIYDENQQTNEAPFEVTLWFFALCKPIHTHLKASNKNIPMLTIQFLNFSTSKSVVAVAAFISRAQLLADRIIGLLARSLIRQLVITIANAINYSVYSKYLLFCSQRFIHRNLSILFVSSIPPNWRLLFAVDSQPHFVKRYSTQLHCVLQKNARLLENQANPHGHNYRRSKL